MITILYMISIGFLLVLSGFFSGSETALFSLRKWQLRQLEIQEKRRAGKIASLLSAPRNLLVTILIGNMMVNVTASTVAESFCHRVFTVNSTLIAIIGTTIFLLIFGEITPKILAIQFVRQFSLFVAYPLIIFQKLISPLQSAVYNLSLFFIQFWSKGATPDTMLISREEIHRIMDMGLREDVMNPREKKIISRIHLLGQIKVSKITVPLEKIFSIDIDSPPETAIPLIVNKGFSRIPVYRKNRENIVGILLLKDLLPYWSGSKKIDSLKPLVHEPVKVRFNHRTINALRTLRVKKFHMAFVTNNQNVVTGIFTIQDLVNILVDDKKF
ncbi:MAG: hypothetical protein A2161_10870 [Candidatus Schekmanbacteria bacterium RBG_13_48_7]|uniref:CNNM transmembrane domain-containing protein n=1 Tax=Candidatus Schekmanbacteria bacterium RBG_13_48_7 TaxID=1817878 RepID=A0A1F7RRT6_9BACT|nr:MAG: hypothetical protein A2161_10870 [Candidatus Schekmanbacteria bacterium RBG_13_48_7]